MLLAILRWCFADAYVLGISFSVAPLTLKMDYLQTYSDQGEDGLGSSLSLPKILDTEMLLPSTCAHSA